MIEQNRPLRLRIVNDFEIVVAGLREMLRPFAHRIEVVETKVKATGDVPADLTLYDTFGTARTDWSALKEVVADPTAGSVVVFAWGAEQELVSVALEIGCRGYLDKMLTAKQLVDGLEQIGAGSVVVQVQDVLHGARVEVQQGETLDDAVHTTWPGQAAGLSEREAEVITLVAQGYTNPQIAARMYITLNSLKSYIRSAYRKIGVERRSQAVRWGIENGMLPLLPEQ